MHSPSSTPALARFEAQRQAFALERNPPVSVRIDRLDRMRAMVALHEERIVQAIDADFGGRSAHETRLAECHTVIAGVGHACAHLRHWMRERTVPTALQFRPGYNRLTPQPLGVVGIVAPWNYPLQLSLGPALGAIAAGNRVLIKPSELTPRFSALLEELVEQAFTADVMSVITGDASVGKAFVALPFDHLFFTGSTAVGREVAKAAAANLTPVTLELGGKSPAILDISCDLAQAASRIAYAKFLNAGQTCVAPDYLLVPEGQSTKIAGLLQAATARLYPSLVANPDYTAIVSPRHRDRLSTMVAEARISGATVIEVNPRNESFDDTTRKFPPTIIHGAAPTARLLHEEIFGPVLPIMEYASVDAAIAHVNAGERPLALYWFGRDAAVRSRVLRETISGGVTVNDCLWHLVQESQPFGGVGASGQGAYHGHWGFETFSMMKPVFYQARFNALHLLHPPYGKTFRHLLGILKKIT